MRTKEIRDPDEVRTFLTQGLWLQRVVAPPTAATVQPALTWALEVLARGQPLPPVGFVADLGHVALGLDWEGKAGRPRAPVPNVPADLLPTYEDHVLGKLYADWTFARAGEALRRYKEGRARARGLAFVLEQFHGRALRSDPALLPWVEFSPAIVQSLLEYPPDELLRQGYESLQKEGPHADLLDLYRSLIAAARRMAEVLDPADVDE